MPRQKIKEIAKSVLPEKNAPHVAGGVSVFIMSVLVLQLILFLLHFMIYETARRRVRRERSCAGAYSWPLVPDLHLGISFRGDCEQCRRPDVLSLFGALVFVRRPALRRLRACS